MVSLQWDVVGVCFDRCNHHTDAARLPPPPVPAGVEPVPLSEEALAAEKQDEVQYRITLLQEEMSQMEVRSGRWCA